MTWRVNVSYCSHYFLPLVHLRSPILILCHHESCSLFEIHQTEDGKHDQNVPAISRRQIYIFSVQKDWFITNLLNIIR